MKTDNEMANDVLEKVGKIKKRRARKTTVITLVLVIILALGGVGVMSITKGKNEKDITVKGEAKSNSDTVKEKETENKFAIAEPIIEEQAQYPEGDEASANFQNNYEDYYEDNWDRRNENTLEEGALSEFIAKTSKEILGNQDGENKTYSPINLYIAFSMLAEATDTETRAQILDLLGTDGIEAVRDNAKKLYLGNYIDNGSLTCLLANSIWLRDDFTPDIETMKTLADYYNAYSFKGSPSDEAYTKAFRDWLNDNTNNFLSDAVKEIEFDDSMIMTLASTIYFSGRWDSEFSPDFTYPETFHGTNGDTETDFMHTERMDTVYYANEFSSLGMNIVNGGTMYLVLPDEGKTPEEILASEDFENFLVSPYDNFESKHANAHITVPKFDVSLNCDLRDVMNTLGVTDVFDPNKADFSPIGDVKGVFLSDVMHSCRVKIDEEGCEAAAFTVMMMCGSSMPEGDIYFTLDRPFIFVLTGDTGEVLFMGVVNNL